MTKRLIKKSDSADQLRGYTHNKKDATVYPDFSFTAVINAVNNDPVARGAVNHFVDKCMEGNYNIFKKDTTKYDKQFETTLQEKYKFRTEVIRKSLLMLKLFNNAYIEIVRDTDNRTKSLNVLDSLNIDPITKFNGDPIQYKSKQANKVTGKYADWNAKDIVWIKFGDRGIGFAPVDMRALWENLLMKEYIKRYVAWLWKTGQYRILYNPKSGAADADIEDFLSFLRKNDNDFKMPFIFKGDLESKMLRDMQETGSIVELLKYLDSQTLILLRVSPIDAGIPDASGRSNADAQSNSLSTSVTGIKKVLEDAINFELFVKMSKANNMLRFGPVDRFAFKQVIENVQIMKSAQMTDDVIQEYMNESGIFWNTEKLFNEPIAMGMGGIPSPNNKVPNPRDKDTAPSRQGKGVGESSKKIGTGSQSTTREDQL